MNSSINKLADDLKEIKFDNFLGINNKGFSINDNNNNDSAPIISQA